MVKQFNGRLIPIAAPRQLPKKTSNQNSNVNLVLSNRNADHQKFITDKFKLSAVNKVLPSQGFQRAARPDSHQEQLLSEENFLLKLTKVP
mmetsp:Transcript_31989/g.23647  ORF Transcript_31989/g.23647 Transcript_31989/m.23647 type:complete len:90 (+) Transcript_31989:353-622(+)